MDGLETNMNIKDFTKLLYQVLDGKRLARTNAGEECLHCGREYSPDNIGVARDSGKRIWITECCGTIDVYEQVISFED